MHAAENADKSHILEPSDVDNESSPPLHERNPAVPDTNKTRNNATLLPSILPPRATSGDDLATAHPFIQHDEASIYTQTLLIGANLRSQKHLQSILWR